MWTNMCFGKRGLVETTQESTKFERFSLEPFLEMNLGILCSGIGNA